MGLNLNHESDFQRYQTLRLRIIQEANHESRLSPNDAAWSQLQSSYGSLIGRRVMERLSGGNVERLIQELEEQNVVWVRSPASETRISVERSDIDGLRCLVDVMTPTLRDEFRRLCEDFDSTPKVRLGHDVKQEIVNAIGTAGWEMVGTDFFEFLGLIQDEISFLKTIPDIRSRVDTGLTLFEYRCKADGLESLQSQVASALKKVDLNRVSRKLFENR